MTNTNFAILFMIYGIVAVGMILGFSIYDIFLGPPEWTVELSKYGGICYELYHGDIAGVLNVEDCR